MTGEIRASPPCGLIMRGGICIASRHEIGQLQTPLNQYEDRLIENNSLGLRPCCTESRQQP